jgi:hypothetical protein
MFDRSEFLATLAGATGGAMAIAIMEAFSASTAFPLVAIPFATSIVTVLARLGKSTTRATPRVDWRPPHFQLVGLLRRDGMRCLNNGRANNAHYSLEPTEWTGRSMAPERIWLLSNRARLSRGCPPFLLPCLFLRLLRDAALCDHRRWLVHGPYRKRF